MLAADFRQIAVEDERIWRQNDREEESELVKMLEQRAKTGIAMDGFKLSRVDLKNIYLVKQQL